MSIGGEGSLYAENPMMVNMVVKFCARRFAGMGGLAGAVCFTGIHQVGLVERVGTMREGFLSLHVLAVGV